ncbi:MAG: DNA polymerase III subunit delta' [Alphaproteobacteria bacterium]
MSRHPRETYLPLGHTDAQTKFLQLSEQDHLPNGLMICGPRGIGKATLAYHLARQLLCGRHGDMEGVSKRITAGSHADLLVVEPAFDQKKGEYAREITAEQARKVSSFLSLTSAESDWRVVIIDSADAMNVQAANAILKILEEPPAHAILLLVCHQPGLLLPTIRSRCQMLRLNAPPLADFTTILQELHPEVTKTEAAVLAELTGRAPGLTIEYVEKEALEMYRSILEIVAELPSYPYARIHKFAENLTRSQPHENWRLFTQLMLMLFARAAKAGSGIEAGGLTESEPQVLHIMSNLRPADHWAEKWAECAEEFSVAEHLHLDYKQVIIAFFHSINTTKGFHTGILAA